MACLGLSWACRIVGKPWAVAQTCMGWARHAAPVHFTAIALGEHFPPFGSMRRPKQASWRHTEAPSFT